jgi:hypothetical protein
VYGDYETGFGLTIGFIGLHSVAHLQPITTESLTITTESQLLLSLRRAQDLLQTQLTSLARLRRLPLNF